MYIDLSVMPRSFVEPSKEEAKIEQAATA